MSSIHLVNTRDSSEGPLRKASHPQQFRFFHSFPVEPIELLDVLERLLPLSPFQFQLFLKTGNWY
jgi:hypothetical protein